MTYGMIFWGNSTHTSDIFKIQKSVFKIIMGRRSGESYRKLLKGSKIFPLKSQYILSSLLFVTNKKSYLTTVLDTTVHILDTAMIYIYLRQTWLFIKKRFIIQALKSLIIFHQISKILLAILRNFNEY